MKLKINNFGIISAADIEIGGLTVLTGENDTGKSTIGKIIFTAIKSLASYQTEFQEDRESRITELVEETYFSLRRFINFAEEIDVKGLFFPPTFLSDIRIDGEVAVHKRTEFLFQIKESKAFDRKLREKSLHSLSEIVRILSEPVDKVSAMKAVFKRIMLSEFKGGVTQKGHGKTTNASIEISEGQNSLISLKWHSNESLDFTYYDSLGYEDATYVDSTSVLQVHTLMDFFQSGRYPLRVRGALPLHMSDIAYKLRRSIYSLGIKNNNSICQSLSSLYGGNFYFDKEKVDFIFERNGSKFPSEVVASGIKSLGMIDILMQSGSVSKNSILILDEPETNLHPKWQVRYAELICKIVNSGATVVVSTHSPYILEALHHYASGFDFSAYFYMATKIDGFSRMHNISKSIQPAIELLAAPLISLHQEEYKDF